MIILESKRNAAMIQRKYPNALVKDMSERHKLSPFYSHEGIRVPFTDGYTGVSVAAIWNSLMVFEDADVDMELRNIRIHTLGRKHVGNFVGIRQGYFNNYIMDVVEARKKILIPMYRWMLEQKVFPIVQQLRETAKQRDIILLDDSMNSDIGNVNQPLSQAWLLKSYVEGLYPYEDVYEIKHVYQNITVGQHSYYRKTDLKVLKKIAPHCCNKQLKIGFDHNNSVFE